MNNRFKNVIPTHLDKADNEINYLQLILLLVGWLLIGIALKTLAIFILLIFTFYLQNRRRYLYIFILFLFTLILSDSRIGALSFSQDLKTLLIPLLLLPFIFPNRTGLILDSSKSFHFAFLGFIVFAFFCVIFSPVPFMAFQKTLSYLLLFIIVPVLFYAIYKEQGIYFLKALINLGVAILIAGYVMYVINPAWVMYNAGERTSGALGNPNGLGMFCFLFFLLYFTIKHYFPEVTSSRLHVIVYLLIFSSLIWSGSRGQTLAVVIFMVTQFLSKRNKSVGLVLSVLIAIMLVTIDIDVVAIAHALGFEEYLRVDTFEQAGGRVVAREFALEHIHKNFWIGRGFSYTEWIYGQHFWELSMKGHEGNAHNAFLTIWLDTGLIGLILYMVGWGILFMKAAKNSFLTLPVGLSVFASSMVESWLAASLNPFTIQVLMILTLLIFIIKDEAVVEIPGSTNQIFADPGINRPKTIVRSLNEN